MNKQEKMDKVCEVAFINLYSISKNTSEIHLKDFSINDDGHLSLLYIAFLCANNFNFNLSVEMTLWDKLKLRFLKKIKIKFIRTQKEKKVIKNCNEIIEDIEKAQNYPNAFKEIYEAYYKKEDK